MGAGTVLEALDWAVAGEPLAGEDRSGDQHLVVPLPAGALLAVIDGLGHGPEAFEAASVAVAALAEHPQAPLRSLVERCHQALRRTRGVVMTVASIGRDGRMEWLGVGNVEGLVVRAGRTIGHEGILLRGGVVGQALPILRPATVALRRGDVVVLATDGIRDGFAGSIDPAEDPRAIASRVLAEHARGGDDALVLVARYRGNDG